MRGEKCPETGGRHSYHRDSDGVQSWVACDCGASPRNWRPGLTRSGHLVRTAERVDLPVVRSQSGRERDEVEGW